MPRRPSRSCRRLPLRFQIALCLKPDQQRVEGPGLDAGCPHQIVTVPPLPTGFGKRCEDGSGAWLVELYADARTRPLADAEPALRLLVAEAVRGAGATALRAVG